MNTQTTCSTLLENLQEDCRLFPAELVDVLQQLDSTLPLNNYLFCLIMLRNYQRQDQQERSLIYKQFGGRTMNERTLKQIAYLKTNVQGRHLVFLRYAKLLEKFL